MDLWQGRGPRVTGFRLELIDGAASAEARWLEVAGRVRATSFLGWIWASAWLSVTGAQPHLLEGLKRNETVALAFIGGGTPNGGTIALNETGDPDLDVGYIEYNGLLSILPAAAQADALLSFLIAARRSGPLRGWHTLRLSGVPAVWEERCRAAGLWVECRNAQSTYVVDLAALRAAGQDVLSTLNANTRQQIRRAMRLYGEVGPLAVTRVEPGPATEAALAELIKLHQARWESGGKPGAFAAPKFETFVRALIARGQGTGEVEILRMSAGSRTLGLLLNLVSAGRVYNYLSGLVHETDNRLKPGLVSHVLAMEHHRARGADSYDLLAGDARYKASLAKPHEKLVWLTVRPPTAANAVREAMRFGRRAAGRALRMVSGSR